MLKKLLIFSFILLTPLFVCAQNTMVKISYDQLFRDGVELLDKEKYAAARSAFEKYVGQGINDLKTIDAEYYIAFSALNLFNPDAEPLYKHFIAKYPYHAKASLAHFDLATFYYNSKKYEKAIQYFEKVNHENLNEEQQLDANFKLAYSYLNMKAFDKAAPLFNKIKGGKHKYTYAASYYAGYLEFRNGEYDAALTDLKKAEENESYKPLVPYMIVNIYYKKGELDQLISYAGTVTSSKQDIQNADEFYLLTGEAYFRKEDYKKAEENFSKYIQTAKIKANPEIQYRLAYSQFKNAQYEDAAENFKGLAIGNDSISQASAYYLGVSYLQTGKKDFSVTAFDQARKSNLNKEIQKEALFNYGKVNFDLERYTEAIPALKEFLKTYPGSPRVPEATEILSESLLKTRDYSDAISYIEGLKSRSLRINSTYQIVTFLKGTELLNNNNFQEAIDMFNRSLEYPINKDYVIYANFWKGEALSYLKDYNAAINAYAAVFTNSKDDNEYYLKARYGIGYAYYNTKQFDKALPHFRAYVDKVKGDKNKQNYNDALLRLADLYYVTKEYEQAIKYYDEAVADKSSDIDYAYYQRGLVKMNLGEVLEAKTNFEAVIKRYPNSLYYDDALFQEGQLELQTGENNDAVKAYSALIGIKPGSPYAPYAYSRRATAYFNLKDYEKAIRDYQYILDNLPTHEESQNALKGIQEALAAAGREEEFPAILAKFKEYNPDNKESASLTVLEFENAKALYNNQKYPQAIQSFLTFISGNPDNPNVKEAQYYMAESYYRQNELTSAIEYYKKVIEDRSSSYYNKSIQRLADLSLLNKDYQTAKNYYLILLTQARGKKDRSIANVGLVDAYYNTQKYDSALYYTSEILKQGNSTLDAESKAMLYQGKIAMAKGENDKAVDHFIQTINAAKDVNAAEAQYLIAKIQYNDKKYKQSLETLYDLNNNFSIYDDWLGRSFLLIAENFVALNELFQAKATLKSIIEKSPHKETKEKAKVRLSELESKEKEKETEKVEKGQEGKSNE